MYRTCYLVYAGHHFVFCPVSGEVPKNFVRNFATAWKNYRKKHEIFFFY